MLIIGIVLVGAICIYEIYNHNHITLESEVKVSFIACGDADVILIEYEGHFVMIDTGEDTYKEEVLDYLESQNVDTIDYIILTHPDKDHIGNAVSIMENYTVNNVYATNYEKGSSKEAELLDYVNVKNINYQVITSYTRLKLEDLAFYIIPPYEEYDSANNSSLVTIVDAGDISFFFGGDIQEERIDDIITSNLEKATIVKLPYHGRNISNLESLLKILEPEYVVITASEPESKTEKLLNSLNIPYECTTRNIVITTDGSSWQIE